ncbi:MAG: hydrogenase maturation protein [Candidatus Methylomirabilales bacterium]
MRILLLTQSFNSLTQRLYVDLTETGHEVSVEFDIHDAVAVEACALFEPDLIVAPFMRRAIPEAVWRRYVCLVVHPGIPGDRGPSALDWAIQGGAREWGVTVLQANAVLDGGPIWAARSFPMRAASKSSLYRNEVTEAAASAVREAIGKFAAGDFAPEPQDPRRVRGRAHAPIRQADRRVDWQRDGTAAVLARIRAADGTPGLLDQLCGEPVFLYNAVEETRLRGEPGALLARRHGAVCRATADGAVWITHTRAQRPRGPLGEVGLKLPAERLLAAGARDLPELPLSVLPLKDAGTYQDIWYEEAGGVGYLHFPFYNGAMGTADCLRLRDAFCAACARSVRVLVLMGGADFWSNGIHLNLIEAADSPADESWANIVAMDDLCLAILQAPKPVIAAMQGNAGAGGVFLALAADQVWARSGVVLNPHYTGMGNLYGSEYWTYLLPRRVGPEHSRVITRSRLPMGAARAVALGLIDDAFGGSLEAFGTEVRRRAERLARDPALPEWVEARRARRARDEAEKPLAAYRAEELARMRLNFYGFDPSYHVARYHFVHRVPKARTPLHLARHRRLQWQRQALLGTRQAASRD